MLDTLLSFQFDCQRHNSDFKMNFKSLFNYENNLIKLTNKNINNNNVRKREEEAVCTRKWQAERERRGNA